MFDNGSINHLCNKDSKSIRVIRVSTAEKSSFKSGTIIVTYTSIDIPFLIYSHSHKKGHNPTVYSNPKNLPLSTTNEHNLKI